MYPESSFTMVFNLKVTKGDECAVDFTQQGCNLKLAGSGKI